MEIYFFEPGKFQQLYNCSIYNVDNVPIEQRKRILLPAISIIFFAIFEILYIPCIFAIWRHLDQSCYKIMFAIGIVDILGLFIVGLLSGILGLMGAVFCTNPKLIYWSGVAGNFFYCFETTSACLLAFNRCVEMASPKANDKLFNGTKTWFWLLLVWLYSAYFCFFDNAVIFSSINYTWPFNPHDGYADEMNNLYTSMVDFWHQFCVTVLMLFFYAGFVYFLHKRHNLTGVQTMSQVELNAKKIVFLQIFLLSAVNTATTVCYILLPFFELNPIIFIICSTFSWQLLHGLPPIIYLAINQSMRSECLKMTKRMVRYCKKKQSGQFNANSVQIQIHVVNQRNA